MWLSILNISINSCYTESQAKTISSNLQQKFILKNFKKNATKFIQSLKKCHFFAHSKLFTHFHNFCHTFSYFNFLQFLNSFWVFILKEYLRFQSFQNWSRFAAVMKSVWDRPISLSNEFHCQVIWRPVKVFTSLPPKALQRVRK